MCLSSHHPRPAEIYTLSLHDALPILRGAVPAARHDGATDHERPAGVGVVDHQVGVRDRIGGGAVELLRLDRKSTRLNSSHVEISYAVVCLKKKKPGTHV